MCIYIDVFALFLDKKSLYATVHDQADFKTFLGCFLCFLGRQNSQRPLIVADFLATFEPKITGKP